MPAQNNALQRNRWLLGVALVLVIGLAALLAVGYTFSIVPFNGDAPPARPTGAPADGAMKARIAAGRALFEHSWSVAEGAGHRNSRGRIDMDKAERMGSLGVNFALFATPTVTSCRACHNVPFAIPGGSGEMITNVIVVRKSGAPPPSDPDRLDDVIVNLSAPPSMFGSGFVEMLARQISADLARQRDGLQAGASLRLRSQDIDFGVLRRHADGRWDTELVKGLPATSLHTAGGQRAPSLRVQPFHQVGAIASLREFTINAFDFHLGIQASERFGAGIDADRDGKSDELDAERLSDIVLYQATLPVPGRQWPSDPDARARVETGERLFADFGCAACHRPQLALTGRNWIFEDVDAQGRPIAASRVDLTAGWLPAPRLSVVEREVRVPVYSDFKLHDITDGGEDRDPLHLHSQIGSPEFFAGTSSFLTARLWGMANQPPYFHHGRHTSILDAVLAHGGEAAVSRANFKAAGADGQAAVVAFLESLQVISPP